MFGNLHPVPPPGLGQKLITLANWALFVFGLAFALGMVYGFVKIMHGERRDGARYFIGGAIGLAFIGSLYAIINGLI